MKFESIAIFLTNKRYHTILDDRLRKRYSTSNFQHPKRSAGTTKRPAWHRSCCPRVVGTTLVAPTAEAAAAAVVTSASSFARLRISRGRWMSSRRFRDRFRRSWTRLYREPHTTNGHASPFQRALSMFGKPSRRATWENPFSDQRNMSSFFFPIW